MKTLTLLSSRGCYVGLILLLACGYLTGVAIAQQPPKLSKSKISSLTRDGDRLADQGDFQAALEKYTEAYLGIVAGIRGQDFSNQVQPTMFNRQELAEEMVRLMKQEYTEDDLLLMDSSYKVFGFIPPELDSGKLMTDLLTEEVAGFYDPDNKRMVLILEDGPQQDPGWLGRLLGAKPAFDKDEQKTTLAHELTHALQDQLYDLNALEEGIEEDDDMLLAFSALVEGDATLLMFAEAGGGEDITDMDPEAMRATFNIVSWMMPLAGGKAYREAPPIFRDSLIFPYLQGMIFTLTIAGEDGWAGVHRAFEQPPVSTEQVMHPAKYRDDVDIPQRVMLPDLGPALAGWKSLGGNCLGELQTSILLKSVRGGKQASIGWDGDRYEVFQDEAGALGLVFVSVWDSPEDADEFATAYRSYRRDTTKRAPPDAEQTGTAAPEASPPAAANEVVPTSKVAVFRPDAEFHIEVHGDQVWVVEGFDGQLTRRVAEALSGCRFEPKRFPIPANR